MKRLLAFAVLAAITLPAHAVRRIAVEQLRQMLATDRAAKKPDASTATQIGTLELTERLTASTLTKLEGDLMPGPKTVLALNLLADSSSFLDPPTSEIPATPPPSIAEQRPMVSLALTFVTQTLQRMPDFLAKRETRNFDSSPLAIMHYGWSPPGTLHLIGTSARNITYRDGREVNDAPSTRSQAKQTEEHQGLVSWGEFGPVLVLILTDTAKGQISWSHWEQTTSGVTAVYRYHVPKEVSHFLIDHCCEEGTPGDLYDPSKDGKPHPYRATPGYHGEISLDPSNGTIVRITFEAELKSKSPITRAALLVEYGAVEIGGKSYICPVRSVALSSDDIQAGENPTDAPILRLNEVAFTGYHRFGSSARIIPDPTAP